MLCDAFYSFIYTIAFKQIVFEISLEFGNSNSIESGIHSFLLAFIIVWDGIGLAIVLTVSLFESYGFSRMSRRSSGVSDEACPPLNEYEYE